MTTSETVIHIHDDEEFRQCPETQDLILDPRDPMPSARELLSRNHKIEKLIHHRDETFMFDGICYRKLTDSDVRSRVWAFLDGALRQVGRDNKRFQPTSARVTDVVDALWGLILIDDRCEPPCWLHGDYDADPNDLIVLANGSFHIPKGLST